MITIERYIDQQINIPSRSLKNTLDLINEGATIPFISRYRKELTGGLDEVQIGKIVKLKSSYEELENRKATIIKAIDGQGLLTPDLKNKITQTLSIAVLEDLYLPYKRKKKTKAAVARERGLEPLAKIIMEQQARDILYLADKYTNSQVKTKDEVLQGARHIISEWLNEDERIRQKLRALYKKKAQVTSKIIKNKKGTEEAKKYRQYEDWSEPLTRCPSHRLLAMLRAERSAIVRLKVSIDEDEAVRAMDRIIIRSRNEACTDQIYQAIDDAYKRLLAPALSNEALTAAKKAADDAAIKVFADNLKQLLLAPPIGEKRILGIDPGYKSGCKIVCLDEQGVLLHNDNIYPHPPQKLVIQATDKVKSMLGKYRIEAIAIGNGTASRETEVFVKGMGLGAEIQVYIVNEAGASIYSASDIAREEFSNYDVTVRGAVSIGRRLADPLAELVKIDPKSIGVGQYQHDVDQTKLKNELDAVVISSVNRIGVNVNTASPSLLKYVSGIGEKLADNIIAYRSARGGFTSRKQLNDVPRLGAKAFEQAAAFLRIKDGIHPLDNSSIHPERYDLVARMAKDQNEKLENLIGNKEILAKIELEKYCTKNVGLPTLTDIIKELEKPGIDPRQSATPFSFDSAVTTIQDVRKGMKLPGIVNNITNFGCFVDIGIKESGLVHLSKLADHYVSDVSSIVRLHQHVEVTVLEVDLDRKRIHLSLKD